MPPEKDQIEHVLSLCSFLHLVFSKVSKACVGCVGAFAQQILRNTGICAVHEHKIAFQLRHSHMQVFLIYKSRSLIQTLNCKVSAKNLLKTRICYVKSISLQTERKYPSHVIVSLAFLRFYFHFSSLHSQNMQKLYL